MNYQVRFKILAIFLVGLTLPSFALNFNHHVDADYLLQLRVDSWPGQPGYPIPTPLPPSWPGNPGYPGNGQYESPNYLFTSGKTAYNQGNYRGAVRYFARFLRNYSSDYRAPEACFLTAESYRHLNDFYSAMQYYRKVSTEYPFYVDAHKAAYFVGYCMVKNSNFLGAATEFRNFISRFPTSFLVDDAWYALGQIYERLNDKISALAAYRNVVYNYPGSNCYSQALERIKYLESTGGTTYPIPPEYPPPTNPIPPAHPGNNNDNILSDFELYQRGHNEFIEGNLNNAVIYFDELIRSYPDSSYADDAYYWKARARWQQNYFIEAISLFQKLLDRYPGSELYPAGLYSMADTEFAYARLNVVNREYFNISAGHYVLFQQKYPTHGYASEALVKAGECYEQLGEYSTAKFYFQQTVNLYPDSPAAIKAKDKLNGTW
ncbi:MAG: hypothetical protein Kow0029_13210 [Candidatus Rifleibacteriota bacterium]